MQLGVGLLHELDPKLLWITAGTENTNSIVLLFLVWQEGIDDNLSPFTVFEELE